MELNELLKELDTNLVIRKIEKSDKTLYLYCDIDCMIVKCKYCGTESHSVHSKYTRTISDLPIQNYQVKLIITVPKFFVQMKNAPIRRSLIQSPLRTRIH